MRQEPKDKRLARRKRRVRGRATGNADRPRLTTFRSLRHMYAQIIDDDTGRTLVSASTLETEVRDGLESTGGMPGAARVGETVAKRALEQGVKRVVFDRNGRLYHGRVKCLAEAAREAGLEF